MLVKEFIGLMLLISEIKTQVTPGCREGSIRLAGEGRTELQGRVEVCFSGAWGTVCDDYWDIFDAMVVCRQLGLDAYRVAETGQFGAGSGNIFLDDVACHGSESRLLDCRYDEHHNCRHSEDAGVICTARIPINIQLMTMNSTALVIQWKAPDPAFFIRSYKVSLSYKEKLFGQLYQINTTTEVFKTSLIWPQNFLANTTYKVCVRAMYDLGNRLTKSCKNWVMPQIYEKSCSSSSNGRTLLVVVIILAVFSILLAILFIITLIYPSCIRPRMKTTKTLSRISSFFDRHVYKVSTGSIQEDIGTDHRISNRNYGFLEFSQQDTDGECKKIKEDPVYAVLQSTDQEDSYECSIAPPPAEPYEVPLKILLNKKDTGSLKC